MKGLIDWNDSQCSNELLNDTFWSVSCPVVVVRNTHTHKTHTPSWYVTFISPAICWKAHISHTFGQNWGRWHVSLIQSNSFMSTCSEASANRSWQLGLIPPTREPDGSDGENSSSVERPQSCLHQETTAAGRKPWVYLGPDWSPATFEKDNFQLKVAATKRCTLASFPY